MRLRKKQATFRHKTLKTTYWLVGVAVLVSVIGWVYRREDLT